MLLSNNFPYSQLQVVSKASEFTDERKQYRHFSFGYLKFSSRFKNSFTSLFVSCLMDSELEHIHWYTFYTLTSQYLLGVAGRVDSFSKTFSVRVSTANVIANPCFITVCVSRFSLDVELCEQRGGFKKGKK